MSWVKDNGGTLAVAVVAMAVVGGYFELRMAAQLRKAVEEETSEIPIITEDRVKAIENDVAEGKDALIRMDGKIDRIIDILLEE